MPRPLFHEKEKMNLPVRKSPRIPYYDYGRPNYYFITICTHNKICYFGNCDTLNELGQIAEKCILCIPECYPNVTVDNYVIMPNHVHAILIFKEAAEKDTLSRVIGQYKMAVTKKIHCINPNIVVWQRSFHDHIIRNQHSYEKIWKYISDNPRKWKEDCFYIAQK